MLEVISFRDLVTIASGVIITLTGIIAILAWMYRQMRNSDIYRAFVYDMANNHLPHIYHQQRLASSQSRQLTRMVKAIAYRSGTDLDVDDSLFQEVDPPPIRFIDLNGRRK
jgi:hypothetical protein